MSDLLFPTLLGLGWDILREPTWRTGVQTSLTGKTSTVAYQPAPIMHWELNFELLRDFGTVSELKQILGLYNAVQGRFDTFLYNDPDFNSVTAQQFAVADGTDGPFQITATNENSGGPGFPEIVQNFNGTPTLYDNGSAIPTGNYVIGPNGSYPSLLAGQVQFVSSFPTSGHPLTWTGAFYYRCRFDDDKLSLSKFMNRLWEAKKLGFMQAML